MMKKYKEKIKEKVIENVTDLKEREAQYNKWDIPFSPKEFEPP